MSFFQDIRNFIHFKKIEKEYDRIFFFENEFIENHIIPYVAKNKNIKKTLIVSFYKIKSPKVNNFKVIHFKKLKILEIFFLFLKIKNIYSSTPDLENTSFKKSIYKQNRYIYIQHSPLSLKIIYNKNAFNAFDKIFVINKFQKRDVEEINSIYKKKIKPWKNQYLFFKNQNFIKNDLKTNKILIAPTWGTNFYEDNFHLIIKKFLKNNGYKIELRPHYMSFNQNDIDQNIKNDFIINSGKLDFSSFDILITDWSGIYLEYAYLTKKKSILVNSKQKILNKDFHKFSKKSIDNDARQVLGYELSLERLNEINTFIELIYKNYDKNKKDITSFFNENFY